MALPLPESLFRVHLFCERGCAAVCCTFSATQLSVSTSAALPWEGSLMPTLWWEQQLFHLRNVACRCKFFFQISSEREWIGAIISSLPASLSSMYPLTLLWSLDPPDILHSPCIATLMRSLIKLTSKLPVTVLAKLLVKVLKHNNTLTLSFSLVKSIRLTL